jgi:hypothetical protein
MTDIKQDNERQELLELLYHEDGRDNPDHPMHSLYTGLYEQHINQSSL